MRYFSQLFSIALLGGWVLAHDAQAGDWVTAPSYYSHDPQTGQRVNQYSPVGPFYTYARTDFRRSGFRQTRSSIQAGGSSDHMHIVEEWGKPVRPYGEWRFPYRPYSVPYDLWGPMFPQGGGVRGFRGPGVGPGFGRGGFGPGGFGGHGGPRPPVAGAPPAAGASAAPVPPFRPYPGYAPQPYDDGRYAPYDSRGPYGYPDLLQRPDPAALRRPAPTPAPGI